MKLEDYPSVIADLRKKKRKASLLLGNGFSMAYDSEIFSYNALHRFIDKLDNELLTKLFQIVNTKNFELVMQQLDNFCELIDAFGTDPKLRKRVEDASELLKESLLNAIEELHPEHVFRIPEDKSKACAAFLSEYLNNGGEIFTTNYDVLLYWVLMRNNIPNSIDGFGRDRENDDEYVPEDELEFSELRWGRNKKGQNVHYVHGALPLFDTGIEIVKEEYDPNNYIMEKIKHRLESKEYPVFVTAGTSNQKLEHILHNQYLAYCYEKLSSVEGTLVTFGFNFGEYDEHLIDAINHAAKQGKKVGNRLWSVCIGVYSEEAKKHIERQESKFKCKVRIFDAKTAPVWQSIP